MMTVKSITEYQGFWHILMTDVTVISGAVHVTMTGSLAVVADEVVLWVSCYDGDAQCRGNRRGRAVTVTFGRGRSGCACSACEVGGS